ncbi:MAG: flagellar basal body P-ring formation chaperone FlgA [Proteobacteria bacterium]|nr:flagellar basal body P-ring formation chaperone FlgA [Pseudomonadota bacterium]
MKNLLLISFFLLHCTLADAVTATPQDHAALRTAVATFVEQQTAGLPGKVAFNVNEIDKRIVLRACSKIEPFLPAGSQMIGNASIGVRCAEEKGWSIFIPVQIRITRDLLISARPLSHGQILHTEDLAIQTTETTQNAGLTDARQIIGKVLRYSVSAGYIMRADMLREPYSVKQGQSVRLSVQGGGFSLSSSGVALNNASEGETVQIRTLSGRLVSGIAGEEGVVQITP